MSKCINCNKEVAPLKNGKDRKYCNKTCGTRYIARKNFLLAKGTWQENNREKYNYLLMTNYQKNKQKWHSRTITNHIIKRLQNRAKLIKYSCYKCGNNNDLEIHHEIYPLKQLEIIDAILENKIVYLCKSCHSKLNIKQNG